MSLTIRNGAKQREQDRYRILTIVLALVGAVAALFFPYRKLVNVVYGLNGYIGFIVVAFMVVADIRHFVLKPRDTDRLICHIRIRARTVHINRNQEVLTVDLYTMPGVKENTNATTVDFLNEVINRLVHLLLRDVIECRHFKPNLFQLASN